MRLIGAGATCCGSSEVHAECFHLLKLQPQKLTHYFYWCREQDCTEGHTRESREMMAVFAVYPLWARLTFLIAVSNVSLFHFVIQSQRIVRCQRCVCPHWKYGVTSTIHTRALLLRVSNNTQSYSKSHHLLKASWLNWFVSPEFRRVGCFPEIIKGIFQADGKKQTRVLSSCEVWREILEMLVRLKSYGKSSKWWRFKCSVLHKLDSDWREQTSGATVAPAGLQHPFPSSA